MAAPGRAVPLGDALQRAVQASFEDLTTLDAASAGVGGGGQGIPPGKRARIDGGDGGAGDDARLGASALRRKTLLTTVRQVRSRLMRTIAMATFAGGHDASMGQKRGVGAAFSLRLPRTSSSKALGGKPDPSAGAEADGQSDVPGGLAALAAVEAAMRDLATAEARTGQALQSLADVARALPLARALRFDVDVALMAIVGGTYEGLPRAADSVLLGRAPDALAKASATIHELDARGGGGDVGGDLGEGTAAQLRWPHVYRRPGAAILSKRALELPSHDDLVLKVEREITLRLAEHPPRWGPSGRLTKVIHDGDSVRLDCDGLCVATCTLGPDKLWSGLSWLVEKVDATVLDSTGSLAVSDRQLEFVCQLASQVANAVDARDALPAIAGICRSFSLALWFESLMSQATIQLTQFKPSSGLRWGKDRSSLLVDRSSNRLSVVFWQGDKPVDSDHAAPKTYEDELVSTLQQSGAMALDVRLTDFAIEWQLLPRVEKPSDAGDSGWRRLQSSQGISVVDLLRTATALCRDCIVRAVQHTLFSRYRVRSRVCEHEGKAVGLLVPLSGAHSQFGAAIEATLDRQSAVWRLAVKQSELADTTVDSAVSKAQAALQAAFDRIPVQHKDAGSASSATFVDSVMFTARCAAAAEELSKIRQLVTTLELKRSALQVLSSGEYNLSTVHGDSETSALVAVLDSFQVVFSVPNDNEAPPHVAVVPTAAHAQLTMIGGADGRKLTRVAKMSTTLCHGHSVSVPTTVVPATAKQLLPNRAALAHLPMPTTPTAESPLKLCALISEEAARLAKLGARMVVYISASGLDDAPTWLQDGTAASFIQAPIPVVGVFDSDHAKLLTDSAGAVERSHSNQVPFGWTSTMSGFRGPDPHNVEVESRAMHSLREATCMRVQLQFTSVPSLATHRDREWHNILQSSRSASSACKFWQLVLERHQLLGEIRDSVNHAWRIIRRSSCETAACRLELAEALRLCIKTCRVAAAHIWLEQQGFKKSSRADASLTATVGGSPVALTVAFAAHSLALHIDCNVGDAHWQRRSEGSTPLLAGFLTRVVQLIKGTCCLLSLRSVVETESHKCSVLSVRVGDITDDVQLPLTATDTDGQGEVRLLLQLKTGVHGPQLDFMQDKGDMETGRRAVTSCLPHFHTLVLAMPRAMLVGSAQVPALVHAGAREFATAFYLVLPFLVTVRRLLAGTGVASGMSFVAESTAAFRVFNDVRKLRVVCRGETLVVSPVAPATWPAVEPPIPPTAAVSVHDFEKLISAVFRFADGP